MSTALLKEVSRLFDDDLRSIATELLHGARTAGATRVAVRTDPDDESITVTDDGEGLIADKAASLLALGGMEGIGDQGRAEWLGLVALARRGATVRSQDWSMTVPPEAFSGPARPRSS